MEFWRGEGETLGEVKVDKKAYGGMKVLTDAGWEGVIQAAGEHVPPGDSSVLGSDRASLVSSELHSRHVFM